MWIPVGLRTLDHISGDQVPLLATAPPVMPLAKNSSISSAVHSRSDGTFQFGSIISPPEQTSLYASHVRTAFQQGELCFLSSGAMVYAARQPCSRASR